VHEADLGMNDSGDDPILRDLRVERVTRADGRYLLYYSWAAEGGADAPTDVAPPDGAAPDAGGPGATDESDV
jgi:hypothetical protein